MQLVGGAVPRKFSFDVLDQRGDQGPTEGALVVGQFDMFDPMTGGRVHGIITCFVIVGDGAFIGGQVFPAGGGVVEVGFRVVDNRPPGTDPDEMTDLITHFDNDAQDDWCNEDFGGIDPDLTDIVTGNIQVRDHPPSF